MNDVNELHEVLAGVVVADRELGDVLTEITGIARRAMPSVAAASVTLIRGEKPSTAAYDGQMALDADELQYERGYGPCMDAGLAGQMFLIDDMRSEQRWSDYAQNVAAHGVLSSLSVREAPRRSRGAGPDRRAAQSKLGLSTSAQGVRSARPSVGGWRRGDEFQPCGLCVDRGGWSANAATRQR